MIRSVLDWSTHFSIHSFNLCHLAPISVTKCNSFEIVNDKRNNKIKHWTVESKEEEARDRDLDVSFIFSLLQVSSLSGRNLRLPALRSGRTTRSLTPVTFFRLPYIFIHSLALHSFTQRLCTCACVSKEPAIFRLSRPRNFIHFSFSPA